MKEWTRFVKLCVDETDRAKDIANAWRHSRKEMIAGRIGSLEGARERTLILKDAEAEGLLDRVVELITGDSK